MYFFGFFLLFMFFPLFEKKQEIAHLMVHSPSGVNSTGLFHVWVSETQVFEPASISQGAHEEEARTEVKLGFELGQSGIGCRCLNYLPLSLSPGRLARLGIG